MRRFFKSIAVVAIVGLLTFHQDGVVCGMNIPEQNDSLNQTLFNVTTETNETNWLSNNITTENFYSTTPETTPTPPNIPDGPCGGCPPTTICATYWPSCIPPPHDCLLTAECKDYDCKPVHICEPYDDIVFG